LRRLFSSWKQTALFPAHVLSTIQAELGAAEIPATKRPPLPIDTSAAVVKRARPELVVPPPRGPPPVHPSLWNDLSQQILLLERSRVSERHDVRRLAQLVSEAHALHSTARAPFRPLEKLYRVLEHEARIDPLTFSEHGM